MSRDNCPLCQQAEGVVAPIAKALEMQWQRVDIDQDPELVARYGWDVPVLLWHQQLIMQHHFDAVLLRNKLASLA